MSSRGKEAVDSAPLGEMAGQGAQIALGRDAFGEAAQLGGIDRHPPDRRAMGQQAGDLLPALLRLERADAINQGSSRRQHRDRRRQEPFLHAAEPGHVVGRLEMRDVGMAADRAGGGAGRVEQNEARRLRGLPPDRVGDMGFRRQPQPLEVEGEPLDPARRLVERDDMRARGGELRGLAAGRGAQIEHDLAGNVAEELRRQRRRRILHPPRATGIAGQRGDRPAGLAPQRSARQQNRIERLAPRLRIAARRDVERRLVQMRQGDGARRLLAIGLAPALPQPWRRVEARLVLQDHERRGFLAEPPQHGVDEALMGKEAPRIGQLDRGCHRGMRRRAEKQQLRQAEAQQILGRRGARRQRPLETMRDEGVDLAEAPQHRRDQETREGAVARLQLVHAGMLVDGFVEGQLLVEHRADQVERRAARRKRSGPGGRMGQTWHPL